MREAIEQQLTNALGILADEKLAVATNALLTDRERTTFASARARLESHEIVVAVIGRQGVGKSSLASALLGRRILPIDETETTNVLCRIRDSGGAPERAVVTFLAGHQEEGPASTDFLRRFTDEQENPGNTLGVRCVDVYLNSTLLPQGFALVDTPGVGSLNSSIGQVTMEFLPDISLGIFLVGTAPTLLNSEALFLRATWRFSRSFIFVQNAWASSAKELEDATLANRRLLQQIAEEEGYRGEVELHVVDVHEGLEGRCSHDDQRVRHSGLAGLIATVSERANAGALAFKIASNVPALLASLTSADAAARARQDNLELDALKDHRGFEERQRRAYDELDRLGRTWRDQFDDFDNSLREMVERLREDVQTRVDDAETRLLDLAQQRKMSAKQLASAVNEQLAFAVKVPADLLQREYTRLVTDFAEEAARLQAFAIEVNTKPLDLAGAASAAAEHEELAGIAGVVHHLGRAGTGALLLPAVWAAGATWLAGEGLAATIAAGAAVVPGIGLAVAGAALLGGYLLKQWQDGKAIDRLVPAIRQAARDARSNTTRDVVNAVQKHASNVREHLDGQVNQSLEQQRGVLQQMSEDRMRSTDDRARVRSELAAHRAAVALAVAPLRQLLIEVERLSE